ncbi:SH3-like domain-containing protein [Cupriavidus basilensis]
MARGSPSARPATAEARFHLGERVRTRQMHPAGHTSAEPRCCRGRQGEIVAVHGAHVFPDASAAGAGDQPQWLYTVRFAASELLGRRYHRRFGQRGLLGALPGSGGGSAHG